MNFLYKTISSIALALSILATTSCATLTDDIEIATHSDPEVNYGAYKTYAWAGSAQIVFDPVGQWEQPTLDTDEEVRFVINRELRDRGLHQVENHPDLFVTFAAGIDTTALELKEDPGNDTKVLINVPKAALMVALIDANTGYAIWLGYAMGEANDQQSIDNIRARIDYAVSKIFSFYK